jgi:hypothetical protein
VPRKALASLLVVLLASLSAIGAQASLKRDYVYKGKTSAGKPVKLKIGYVADDGSTWVTFMSFSYPVCGGSSGWVVNGGEKVSKPGRSFSYRSADPARNGGGYTDLYVVHGKVSGWDAKRKAWKRASGSFRRAYGQPAYTDDLGTYHPAYRCDHTYHWTATRR